jgi:hypothetical protein
MQNFLVCSGLGIAAAVIDVAPMALRKLDPLFILSAFFFWLFLGFLIPNVTLVPLRWLNGVVVAWMMLVPLAFLVFKLDRSALPVMAVSTTVLGAAIGIVAPLVMK